MQTSLPFLTLLLFTISAARAADATVPDAGYLSSAEAVAAGEKLFAAACGACHGKSGEGARGPNLADGGLIRRLNNTRLFASVKNGVPGTDMPGFPMADTRIWQIIAFVRSLSSPAMEARLDGDPVRGATLFYGSGGCGSCHSIRGRGGSLGPDLSNAGALMSVKQLRESITDPGARIAAGYRAVSVRTNSGETVEGVAKNSNNYSLQVLDVKGKLHLFDARDVRSVQESGKSLMPPAPLKADELNDLLAFVAKQSVRSEAGRRGR